MNKKLQYIIGWILLGIIILIYQQSTSVRYNFRIIKPNIISVFFVKSGSTTKEFWSKYNCNTTINGSYFWRNPDWTFSSAGLRYSWNTIATHQNHEEQDPNLQSIVLFSDKKPSFEIVPNTIPTTPQTGAIAFNAWPILIEKWKTNPSISQDISHRNKKFPRTILIKNDKEEVFFLLIFNNVTLIEATDIIKQQKQLWKNYDVINLDWWPSTSLYSKLSSKDIFNEHEILPIFFCLN